MEAASDVQLKTDATLPERLCGVEEANVIFAALYGADAKDDGDGVLRRRCVQQIELGGVRKDAVFTEWNDANGGAGTDGVLLPVVEEVIRGGLGNAGYAIKPSQLANVVWEAANGFRGGVLGELEGDEVVTDGNSGPAKMETGKRAVVFFPEDFREEERVKGIGSADGAGEGAALKEVRKLAEGVLNFAADRTWIAGALAFEVAGFLSGDRAPGVKEGIKDDGLADVAAAQLRADGTGDPRDAAGTTFKSSTRRVNGYAHGEEEAQ